MYTRVPGPMIFAAAILAFGAVGAMAQDRMTAPQNQQQTQSPPIDRDGDPMEQDDMMGGSMMGPGMMGHGMMAPPIMRIVFVLADTDGDGALSLEEFQAAHEKIFKAMDADKDGKLTPDEMKGFMHGPE